MAGNAKTAGCPTCGPTCRGCPDCQGISLDEDTNAALCAPVHRGAGLTNAELALCAKLGECWNDFMTLGPVAGECAEAASAIHAVQRIVMARAARRAHPEVFR